MAATSPPQAAGPFPVYSGAISANRAAMAAFLVAGVTLSLQILIHRIVSAKLLNNYAFLVISLTMLGFAAAGVALTAIQGRVLARLGDSLVFGCCLLALSAVIATSLFAASHLEADTQVTRVSLVRSRQNALNRIAPTPHVEREQVVLQVRGSFKRCPFRRLRNPEPGPAQEQRYQSNDRGLPGFGRTGKLKAKRKTKLHPAIPPPAFLAALFLFAAAAPASLQ